MSDTSNIETIKPLDLPYVDLVLVRDVLISLKFLSSADRLKIFETIQEHFCIHCGDEQPSKEGICQCWNDE